ncbi:protein kinase A catalytic subunit [Cokeromyces recurvatus]|uniref:protein kinase A catalytic subunit n=1 Tax=Cokeromyces recurvatus TaxID=90255 RepID=UPI00221ED7E5|nr:protein kinase A catalytic subunit [Cokeromyces recurvatus]KAI7901594.1 protein kinase A catalytic subunit [Cokeromyces recurvatus]
MADFTDSLIKNIGAHSSKPMMASMNMGQLGEKLRQALHYEGNVTSTLDQSEDGILPNTPLIFNDDVESGAFKAFEIMMKASSPKWMHRVNFDVSGGDKEIQVFVYDRGNKLPNGEDRFLGMSSIKPNLKNKKTVELIFPLCARPDDDQEVTGDVRLQVTYTNNAKVYLKPEDFRIVRMIGQGSLGKVYEVVKRDSGCTYAMKVLSKRLLLAEDEVDTAFNERNVLVQSLSNPFIANLKYSFQTTHHLFLIMDYFRGGELFDFLEREGCLSEKRCHFFAAEIVCALEHIHANHIVYRNLKPESILLDAHGHLALTDFGLCKILKTRTDLVQEDDSSNSSSVLSKMTPEYVSPEIIMKKPYGMAADWWSLGILMFELLTGSPPFHSMDSNELHQQILEAPVKFPSGGCISEEAKDFVYRLLERDPKKRLGSQGDAAEVKAHPFFKDVRWDLVYEKQMQLPFTPEVEEQLNEEAIATASAIGIPMTKMESNSSSSSTNLPIADQSKFKGFSYVREETNLVKLGTHRLGIHPEDEDPEIDFWFRQ